MGHAGNIIRAIIPQEKKFPAEFCSGLGLICCWQDETLEKCLRRLARKHDYDFEIPGWPKHGTDDLYCAGVPDRLKNSWDSALRDGMYDNCDCGCKKAGIRFNCDEDIMICTKKMASEWKLPHDPCRKDLIFDCKIGKCSFEPRK
jgi:hypothetical protein